MHAIITTVEQNTNTAQHLRTANITFNIKLDVNE